MCESNNFNKTPGQDFTHFATEAMHAGFSPDNWYGCPVVLPISMSTTFKQEDPGKGKFEYGRSGNPTREGLERLLAALEGAKYALAFSCGLAATDVIIHHLNSGDHIVCMDDVYGGTQRLIRMLASKHGITGSFVDMTNLDLLKSNLTAATKVVWIETPTNPTMKIVDIAAAIDVVRKFSKDIIIVVDNTFASPYFQRPLQLGADICLESLTKYVNGHSDVVMGSIATNNQDLYEKLKYIQNAAGPVPSPFDCYLVWRGAKTLPLRMRQHHANGLAVAKFLEGHPMVEKVLHPGLPSHPQHELAKRQMRGYSGTFSFYLRKKNADLLTASKAMLSAVKMFICAESLGGYESLIEHPAIMTHASVPAEKRAELGISDGFVRVSVGLEDAEDLIADLKQALDAAAKA